MPRQNGLSCATSSAKPFLPIPTNPSPLSFGGNFRRSFSTAWWALLFLGFTQEILSASASEAPSLNFTKPKRSGAVSLAGCCASQNRTKAPASAPSCNLFAKDIAHSLNGFGFLVARSAGLRVLGSVWNSSLFPGRAPEGHALLTSFVGGTTDPAAAKLNPEELASLVHREISPLLSIRSEPVFSNVPIWPGALPQYNLGHSDRLAAVAKLCSRFPGLWLTGNYLRGPAIGSCVEQALAVADEVRNHLTA